MEGFKQHPKASTAPITSQTKSALPFDELSFHNACSSSGNSTASSSPVNSFPNSPVSRVNLSSLADSRLASNRPRSLIVANNSKPNQQSSSSKINRHSICNDIDSQVGVDNDSSHVFVTPPPQSLFNSTHHFQSINPAPVHLNSTKSITKTLTSNTSGLTGANQKSPLISTLSSSSNDSKKPNQIINNSNFSSSLSSFTSITKNQIKQLSIQSPSNNLNNANNSTHLSPSPLAISDGLTISYGNSNNVQTFKPTSPAVQSSCFFSDRHFVSQMSKSNSDEAAVSDEKNKTPTPSPSPSQN